MPCRCDYMEPTRAEIENQRVCKLILYVAREANISIEKRFVDGADNTYCNVYASTPYLCAMLKNMDDERRNSIVYNAKNRTARDLADWWEDHLEADARHEKEDAENS